MASGVYKYIPEEHTIEKVAEGEVRGDFDEGMLKKAPVLMLISANFEKAIESYGEEDLKYVYMEAGHVGQNVYLQAEALGLGTCAVAGVAGAGNVREAFAIPANEVGLYLMPVGYYN